jgi:hypothetical protein
MDAMLPKYIYGKRSLPYIYFDATHGVHIFVCPGGRGPTFWRIAHPLLEIGEQKRPMITLDAHYLLFGKKTTLMPLTVWVGEARECFFCHVSIAPAYRYDATVADRKADDFGE